MIFSITTEDYFSIFLYLLAVDQWQTRAINELCKENFELPV